VPCAEFRSGRSDLRPAPPSVEQRQVEGDTKRRQESREHAANGAVADDDRTGNYQRRAQVRLLDADLCRRARQLRLRCEQIGSPPQQVRWHANFRPASIARDRVDTIAHGNRERAGRFGQEHGEGIERFAPRDLDEPAPGARLGQIGGGTPHIEVGREAGLVAQRHYPQDLLLQVRRLFEQNELCAGAAILDVLAGNRRGGDAALIRAQIARLGVVGRGGADLGSEPAR